MTGMTRYSPYQLKPLEPLQNKEIWIILVVPGRHGLKSSELSVTSTCHEAAPQTYTLDCSPRPPSEANPGPRVCQVDRKPVSYTSLPPVHDQHSSLRKLRPPSSS